MVRHRHSAPQDCFISIATDGGGLRFHYRDWGGKGQPVVLLHGLASNARIWDLTVPSKIGSEDQGH